MSVSVSVQLPDKPASGITTDRAIGGPGAIAPHSYQDCQITGVSDASSGTNTVFITTDPRWTSLFAWATVIVLSPAAAIPVVMDILVSDEGVNGPRMQGVAPLDTDLGVSLSWIPPPALGTSNAKTTSANLPMRLRAVIPNVDTESLILAVRVYNFRKDIQQLIPLSQLLSTLPRGGSVN